MPDAVAIRIDRLRIIRGRAVVIDDLTCEVARGSVTGLLGPSGSGKTTLIRAIAGVQRIAGGDIEVLGEPAGTKALRSRVGYMTQASSVYDDLTVGENLRFFARVRSAANARTTRQAVDEGGCARFMRASPGEGRLTPTRAIMRDPLGQAKRRLTATDGERRAGFTREGSLVRSQPRPLSGRLA